MSEIGGFVDISQTGFLLATTTKGTDVAIFDKLGSSWQERVVLNVCATGSVSAMAMSAGSFVPNPAISETPFVLVVTCEGSTVPVVRFCREGNCMVYLLERPEEADGSFGNSVAVSTDGGVVAVSSRGDPNSFVSGLVSISRAAVVEEGRFDWIGGTSELIVPIKYEPPVITASPTSGPTASPTLRPTESPTFGPTARPTSNSTEVSEPTLSPTSTPSETSFPSSVAPTDAPSDAPSDAPAPQAILAMSLSGDGSALAIAAADTPDSMSAQIHYYRFNGSSWVEQGIPLTETRCSAADFSVQDMAQLSEDGQVLLVSGGTTVSLFKWDEEFSGWISRGDPIEHEECSVKTVSLSASGNQVAMESVSGQGNDVESTVSTYGWTGSWERREREDFVPRPGGYNARIAQSYNGREIAIGLPLDTADRSGKVLTYEFPRTDCGEDWLSYRVTMTIRPTVTQWSYFSQMPDDTFVVTRGGPFVFPNFPGASNVAMTQHEGATIVQDICIPFSPCANFTLYPPNFGGAASVTNGVVQLQLQNEEVFTAVGGYLPSSECTQVPFPPLLVLVVCKFVLRYLSCVCCATTHLRSSRVETRARC